MLKKLGALVIQGDKHERDNDFVYDMDSRMLSREHDFKSEKENLHYLL